MWELDHGEAECWRIDAFKLWYWRRILRVPWTLRKSNQSGKEINFGYSLEWTNAEAEAPILLLPDAKSWLTGKDPDVGKDWRQEEKGMTGWDDWMALPTLWTWVCINSGSWWWTGRPGVLRFMGSQRVQHNLMTEQQQPVIYSMMLWKQVLFSVPSLYKSILLYF